MDLQLTKDIVVIDKKSYMATTTSEFCIKEIAKISMDLFQEVQDDSEISFTKRLNVGNITKDLTLIGVAFGALTCGYILANLQK